MKLNVSLAIRSSNNAKSAKNQPRLQTGHSKFKSVMKSNSMTKRWSLHVLFTAKFLMLAYILIEEMAKQHSENAKTSYQDANQTSARLMPHHVITVVKIITSSITTSAQVEVRERKDAAGAARLISLVKAALDALLRKAANSARVGTSSSATNAGSPSGDEQRVSTIL